MKKAPLILKFCEKNDKFEYDNKIFKVEDKNLVKNLSKTNINNSYSTLVIESLDNLPIYDVIQFKINVSNAGTFLINYKKDQIDDDKRSQILNEISKLKEDGTPTIDSTRNKIFNLIKIINTTDPIYVSFRQNGELLINFETLNEILKEVELSFPLLILEKQEKTNGKLSNLGLPDLVFASLFSILAAFALHFSIYELFNKESIAAFLLIITLIFVGIISYISSTEIFNKKEEKLVSKISLFFAYILFGTIIGIIIGFLATKFILETNENVPNLMKVLWLSLPIAIGANILEVAAGKLITIIKQKIIK